jgi:hypothetical protein
MRKVVTYIVYGDSQIYYDGAKYSILTFLNWVNNNDPIEIVVLTENPDQFAGYPVKVFLMNGQQKNEWSINGNYHFRIKNRGLAYIMDKLSLEIEDKILFFDTDTYFHKSPVPLFNMIKKNQAVFYINEGLINKRKRFDIYAKSLNNIEIKVDDSYYKLSNNSSLWGSLMVGIMPNMRSNLEWADKLMLELFKIVPAHTIEEFSLSESLQREFKLLEGKKYVGLYSTSRKKEYATKILSNFFLKYSSFSINRQVYLAQLVKIKRPFMVIIKQRISSLFKNL